MRVLFLLFISFYSLHISFAQKLTPLDLAGTWLNVDSTKNSGEEWLMKDSTELNGFGFVIKNDRTQKTETLMLKKMNNHWLYIAQVGKQNPISFALEPSSNNALRFVNKEHDFPQYIFYEFVAKDHVIVKVGNKGNKRVLSFEFKRA